MQNKFSTYFLLLIATVFATLAAKSQHSKSDLLLNLGFSSGYGYPNGLPETENSGVPALNFDGEYSLNKFIGIGIYGAYTYSFYKYNSPTQSYKDNWIGWDMGARLTLHIASFFIKNEKADLYLAGFSGYTTMALKLDKNDIYRDSLDYRVKAFSAGPILGFRYAVSPRFAFYLEAGTSRMFFVGGGVTFKIPSKK
jgi:hypothetical protein